jgi:hypothetical protein
MQFKIKLYFFRRNIFVVFVEGKQFNIEKTPYV